MDGGDGVYLEEFLLFWLLDFNHLEDVLDLLYFFRGLGWLARLLYGLLDDHLEFHIFFLGD